MPVKARRQLSGVQVEVARFSSTAAAAQLAQVRRWKNLIVGMAKAIENLAKLATEGWVLQTKRPVELYAAIRGSAGGSIGPWRVRGQWHLSLIPCVRWIAS